METKEATFCKVTTRHYHKKPCTKTVYVLDEETTEDCPREHYNNYIESAPFFRRLGGSETLDYGYFSKGYLCYKITSKSPDRQTKVVRTFDYGED